MKMRAVKAWEVPPGADAGVRRRSPLLIRHQSASVDSRRSAACYDATAAAAAALCLSVLICAGVRAGLLQTRVNQSAALISWPLPEGVSITVCFSRLAPPPPSGAPAVNTLYGAKSLSAAVSMRNCPVWIWAPLGGIRVGASALCFEYRGDGFDPSTSWLFPPTAVISGVRPLAAARYCSPPPSCRLCLFVGRPVGCRVAPPPPHRRRRRRRHRPGGNIGLIYWSLFSPSSIAAV